MIEVLVLFNDEKEEEFKNIKDVKMYYGVIELVCLSGGSILFEKENIKKIMIERIK